MSDSDNAKEKAVKDVLETRREFTLENPENEIHHYFIANPTGEDIRKSDWQYSKVFNQAIVDGFLTQSEMLKVLQDKEIVSDEYTTNLENVRINLGAELFKLENFLDEAGEEEREAVATDVSRLREELFQLNQRVNGPMANTCESLAEDARTEFLTSRIIQNKDGSNIWLDFDVYKNDENTALAIKSRFEVMLWMQGLESNFLENTPEQSTLREISQARMERALETIAEDNPELEGPPPRELDKDSLIEEMELAAVEEKPKKKRGRPKGKVSKAKPKVKSKAKPKGKSKKD